MEIDGLRERERQQEERLGGHRVRMTHTLIDTRIYIFRTTPCRLSAVTLEFIREGERVEKEGHRERERERETDT